MEASDLALSDVHVAEYHQKVGVLQIHTAALISGTDATPIMQSTVRTNSATSDRHTVDNGPTTAGVVCTPYHSPSEQGICVASDQNTDSESYEVCRTRYTFNADIPASSHPGGEGTPPPLEYDEDGDLVVPRRTRHSQVIHIDHTLGTRLLHVGLQVWQGCLLLCDFILDRGAEFEGVTALELGGGVGLASIVMATVAKRVICTDVGDSVLALCEKNVEANKHLCNQYQGCKDLILIKELDWTEDNVTEGTKGAFHWRPDDVKLLDDVTVLFAADVVYDADLTEAFLHTVTRLLSTPPHRVLYVALERRLNFTLDDLEVACPAYEHFVSCLEQLGSDGLCGVRLDSHQVDVDFPQRFEYNRTPQLVLWKIMPKAVT